MPNRDHSTSKFSIGDVNRFLQEKVANVPKDYQRNYVWRKDQKQNLIDSIINSYDIPKIYFAVRQNNNDEEVYDIIDGQQRCLTLQGFLANEFALSDEFKYHAEIKKEQINLAGLKYKELPRNIREKILRYQLDVVLCKNYSKDDQKELFERLQGGTNLSQAESRRAMKDTNMPQIVTELSKHPLFKVKKLLEKKDIWGRFWVEEIIANILLDLHKDSISEVSASNLRKMYKEKKDIKIEDDICKRINDIFDYMVKSFKNKEPLMPKVAIRRLAWILHDCIDNYNLKKFHKELADAYLDFETDRTEITEKYKDEDPSDENIIDKEKIDEYQLYAAKSRAYDKSGQQTLDKILKDFIFIKLENLVSEIDNKKFSQNQRSALLRRSNGRCQADTKASWYKSDKCLNKITLDTMHADHINPKAYGGKALLKNGQALCKNCNSYKSDQIN
jgi:uncharacterized protein with ParB-like and HNH nuclease domain